MKKAEFIIILLLNLSLIMSIAEAQSLTEEAIAQGLSELYWDWSNGANVTDAGTGRPMRNWDRQSRTERRLDDIYLNWEDQPHEFEEFLVFIGWQGWPFGIIQKDHPEGYYLPEYVENLVKNNYNSVKYFTVKASEVPANCIKFPASKTENEFYYVKLVGRTKDNKFYDIKGCEFGSEYRRTKNKMDPVPQGTIPDVKVPEGGRERNSLEIELTAKAKKNKR